MKRKRLGEVLRERKRISAEDLQKTIDEQQVKSILLGELLLQRGLVGKDDLVAALEEVTRFRYVDCRFATVETAVLELVPRSAAIKNCALPLVREGNRIIVVMAEPQNLHALDELRFISGMGPPRPTKVSNCGNHAQAAWSYLAWKARSSASAASTRRSWAAAMAWMAGSLSGDWEGSPGAGAPDSA